MAICQYGPVEVRVRTDWISGRPRSIRWAGKEVWVTRLRSVRHEDAAYPVVTGPRTFFEVETSDERLALSYHHRSRRWLLEGREAAEWLPHPSI